jgi:hypothetical protein
MMTHAKRAQVSKLKAVRAAQESDLDLALDQARTMLAAFEAAGVRYFALTLATEDRQRWEYRPKLTPKGLSKKLPMYFEYCERLHLNFIIRPKGSNCRLVQLDDLDIEKTKKICTYGFLAIETSPGNYQVWLAVENCDSDFTRRLKRGVGADMGASGAVKIAGSINFKSKYAPNYPRVKIFHTNIGQYYAHYAEVEELETSGIVAEPIPVKKLLSQVKDSRPPNAWPDYQKCLDNAPDSTSHEGPDRSRADYTWSKIALQKFRWLKQSEKVAEKLYTLSEKAQERGEEAGLEYCRSTVQSALRDTLEEMKRSGALK